LPVAASKRRTIIDVERIELDAAADATGLVGRDEGDDGQAFADESAI
jgi:hypothetical protein